MSISYVRKFLMAEIRLRLSKYPCLFYSLYRYRDRTQRLGVVKDTDIVIEGYPRSANSFAVIAFETAQECNLSIAHHLHVPVQVEYGIRYGLPTLVLIRDPMDAAVSLVIRQPYRTVAQALREYIQFYDHILSLPRQKYVVADFSTVTTEFGQVIDFMNDRFGTDYNRFDHTEENEQEVFETLQMISPTGRHKSMRGSWPSEKRDKKKKEVRAELDTPEYAPLLQRCRELHDTLT
jgi:hypothetical protein